MFLEHEEFERDDDRRDGQEDDGCEDEDETPHGQLADAPSGSPVGAVAGIRGRSVAAAVAAGVVVGRAVESCERPGLDLVSERVAETAGWDLRVGGRREGGEHV